MGRALFHELYSPRAGLWYSLFKGNSVQHSGGHASNIAIELGRYQSCSTQKREWREQNRKISKLVSQPSKDPSRTWFSWWCSSPASSLWQIWLNSTARSVVSNLSLISGSMATKEWSISAKSSVNLLNGPVSGLEKAIRNNNIGSVQLAGHGFGHPRLFTMTFTAVPSMINFILTPST